MRPGKVWETWNVEGSPPQRARVHVAVATLVIHIARFGVAREADEGAAAHFWQLLMAGQLPVIAFFAIKWR